MKKIIALLLCAVMLLALCACGETRIESYEDDTTELVAVEPAEEATETAETAETVETTAGLDWAAAYAQHDPSDVVIRVDGEPITWQELFYELANVTSGLQSAAGSAVTDWNATLRDSAGNEATCGDYVLSYALTVLAQYHVVYSKLTAEGVVLSSEGEEYVQAVKQAMIDNYFGGDKEQFLSNLAALFCSEELYDWFNRVDELYAEGFGFLYGEDGADLTDDEVLAYASENGYVQLRQIYIYPETETESESETETETAAPAVDIHVLDALAAQLGAAVDDAAREELFDGLYAQYNENADLDVYGASRAVNTDDVSIGSVDEGVYSAALALEDYGYACVSTGDAAVLVMRVPLEASAPVYYETAMAKMCDLRYYAASQRYLELINGETGWIASAQLEWEPEFIGFNLVDAFNVNATETVETTETTETTETATAEPDAASNEPDASAEPSAEPAA